MKYLFFCFSFLIIGISHSQNGDVTIIKDSRLDALVKSQGEVIPPETRPQINGFRIQLFFDSNKDALNSRRAQFITKFPKIDTYTEYNAPNFFLKAGDFRTRLEAEKIKAQIEGDFPTSFVIKEKIYLPRLEKDNN